MRSRLPSASRRLILQHPLAVLFEHRQRDRDRAEPAIGNGEVGGHFDPMTATHLAKVAEDRHPNSANRS